MAVAIATDELNRVQDISGNDRRRARETEDDSQRSVEKILANKPFSAEATKTMSNNIPQRNTQATMASPHLRGGEACLLLQ